MGQNSLGSMLIMKWHILCTLNHSGKAVLGFSNITHLPVVNIVQQSLRIYQQYFSSVKIFK